MTSTASKRASLVALGLALAGCAGNGSLPENHEPAEHDPWERANRGVYRFNDGLDRVLIRPLATGYVRVVPRMARRGVGNFFANLNGPLHIVNNLLQGDLGGAVVETGRLAVNSTLGLGGLIDVGTDVGWEADPEDFGQTLAVWGVPDGPYVVLPFFGPRTLRDAVTYPLDKAADPLYYVDDDSTRFSLIGLRLIDFRAGLFAADSLLEDSFDPYLTLRESYLQNRQYNIYDGEPPEDDDFYDDFEDFDEPEAAPDQP